MGKMYFGIDVSKWNGDINWGVVKNQIGFAIIRAGYGNNNIDPKAEQNVKGCEDNNIPFGLYWFSYAYTPEMAKNEAKYLLEFVKGHTPLYPLYFDFEYDSVKFANKKGVTVDSKLVCEMATAFCEELENAGYYAGIYANNDYVKNMYGEEIFKQYDLWYAKWHVSEPGRKVNLWQCTDVGSVIGISGDVDCNCAFIDYPKLIKEKEFNGYKAKPEFTCHNCCPYCQYSNGVKTR